MKAGDTILVHAGTYAYHYEFYGNQTTVNATTTFEGTYYLSGNTWFQPAYGANGVYYTVVPAP